MSGFVSRYRYNFQGQEKDPELWGGSIAFKYRIEDPRLGRFFSLDPLEKKYPYYSPYAFSGNRVMDATELEGLEPNPLNYMDEGFRQYFQAIGNLFSFSYSDEDKTSATIANKKVRLVNQLLKR